jgi:hypothetical protein
MSDLRVNRVRSLDGGTVEFVDGVSGNADGLRFGPKILQYSPLALSTDVQVTTNQFQFTFDQPIKFYGTGTIQIIKSSNSSVYESFAITNGGTAGVGVTIANNVLQLNTSAGNFEFFTNYHISFPSAGIANTYNDPLLAQDGYTFRTGTTSFDVDGGDFQQVVVDSNSPTGYYKYNIFTTTGIATFSGPSASATDFAYVLVGGGGAGSRQEASYEGGGGGGAGGYVKNYNSSNLPAGTYSISIGAGGQGAFSNPGGTNSPHPTSSNPAPWPQMNSNGSNSSFGPTPLGTIIAYGGGKAGIAHYGYPTPSYTYPVPGSQVPLYYGSPGGSGGGGTVNSSPATYPTSSPTRRHPGGVGRSYPSPNQQGYPGGSAGTKPGFNGTNPGGGGGGAGGAGASQSQLVSDGSGRYYQNSGGSGGAGAANPEFPGPGLALIPGFPGDLSNALGPSGYLAGGGGSEIYTYPTRFPSDPWTPPAPGGSGGGGDGFYYVGPPNPTSYPNPYWNSVPPRPAQPGVQNTGGGGGGGQVPAGPSGVIPTPAPGNWYGAPGGSGIMMIRFAHPGV